MRAKIDGEPVAKTSHGHFIATFDDPQEPQLYMKGLLWVHLNDDGFVSSTEGVRKDVIDGDMWPEFWEVYLATLQAIKDGKTLPRLIDPLIDFDPGESERIYDPS